MKKKCPCGTWDENCEHCEHRDALLLALKDRLITEEDSHMETARRLDDALSDLEISRENGINGWHSSDKWKRIAKEYIDIYKDIKFDPATDGKDAV